MTGHWVHSWASMPQLTEPENLPPAPYTGDNLVLAGATLRQTIRTSVGGERLRLRISNVFGGAVLPITSVTVARPVDGRAGVSAIQPDTCREVTFSGRNSARIPVGTQMVSDPVEFAAEPCANLSVTIYLADGLASTNVTSHPGSRTTSYLVTGDHTRSVELPGAVPVEHWYLLSGLEVWSPPGSAAAVMLGDSLTDGRGSTTNGNDRWPDRLADRLRTQPGTSDVAVVNEAAGGNRVLHDGLGPSAASRLDRDVLALGGVAWLVVFEGVNDIGTAEATPEAQQRVADDLIIAYDQIIRRAHAVGIRVYGATITPFGGAEYDDPAGLRASTRRALNAWIRNSGRFDAVLDFDAAVRDPRDPGRLAPACDTGDHLHLSPHGYQLLADAVPTELLQHEAVPRYFGRDQ